DDRLAALPDDVGDLTREALHRTVVRHAGPDDVEWPDHDDGAPRGCNRQGHLRLRQLADAVVAAGARKCVLRNRQLLRRYGTAVGRRAHEQHGAVRACRFERIEERRGVPRVRGIVRGYVASAGHARDVHHVRRCGPSDRLPERRRIEPVGMMMVATADRWTDGMDIDTRLLQMPDQMTAAEPSPARDTHSPP